VPADILLLYCNNFSHNVIIDSKSMDGESSLKQKICNPILQKYYSDESNYDKIVT